LRCSRYIQKHSFKERIQGTVALPFEKEMAGVLQIFLSFHRTEKYKQELFRNKSYNFIFFFFLIQIKV
jgi:hypothetical protein